MSGQEPSVRTTREPSSSPAATHTTSAASDNDDRLRGFDHFWNVWPRRNGKRLHRGKAEAQWVKLPLDERRAAYRGARNYAQACELGGQGRMDAFRWLRDRSWEDWQDPPVPDQPTRGRSAEVTYIGDRQYDHPDFRGKSQWA